jgi:hypothetical protein
MAAGAGSEVRSPALLQTATLIRRFRRLKAGDFAFSRPLARFDSVFFRLEGRGGALCANNGHDLAMPTPTSAALTVSAIFPPPLRLDKAVRFASSSAIPSSAGILLERCKKTRLREIPVVIMTEPNGVVHKARTAEAEAVLHKPFMPQDLLPIIRQFSRYPLLQALVRRRRFAIVVDSEPRGPVALHSRAAVLIAELAVTHRPAVGIAQ